jgi:hypothetical protein
MYYRTKSVKSCEQQTTRSCDSTIFRSLRRFPNRKIACETEWNEIADIPRSLLVGFEDLLRCQEFFPNRGPLCFAPDLDFAVVVFHALHEARTGTRIGVAIRYGIGIGGDVESPEEFRGCDEKVTLCEMNSRTNPTTGSVAEVIAVCEVFGSCINRCKSRVGFVTFRNEVLRGFPSLLVVVECPNVEYDG